MKLFIKHNRRIIVFGAVVVLFLVGIGVIQLVLNQYQPFSDMAVVKVDEEESKDNNSDDPQATVEKLLKPVSDDVKLVKKFYDANMSDKELEGALVYFEGVYRPNLGVDFSNDNKKFDVIASISGTVTKKDNDALLGWVVTITNETGISTTYQSLSEVSVEKDAIIKQGDKIGISGQNVYESELKTHLHFVLEKDNQAINPEKYFNQDITKIVL